MVQDEKLGDLKNEHVETTDYVQPVPTLSNHTTWRMIFFSAWISIAGWFVNWDLSYTGIVLQMQPFNRSFGSCGPEPVKGAPAGTTAIVCRLSAPQQSVITIYLLFLGVGGGLASITGTYLGRKRCIQLSCLVIAVGAAGMIGSAGSYVGYIVCKCISGLGIGQLTVMAPVYGTEVTPPGKRALLVSIYSIGLSLGALCIASICLGTSSIPNDWSWKTPILCQIPVAVIYGVGMELFPESPRWLMVQQRVDEAKKSFARYYDRDENGEEVAAQIQDVQDTLDHEMKLTSHAVFFDIFRRRYLRRTLTSMSIIANTCLTGINFIIPFGTIFLAGLGLKSPFHITVYLDLCIWGGTLFGPIPNQLLGRRLTILIGYALMASCMLIFAAVCSGSDISIEGGTAQKVLVAFLCLWTFCFGCFNASTTWLAGTEQHSVRHRTYGQAFTMICTYILNFASTFWTPYMINPAYGNMGTNVGYFYFGTLVWCFICSYFTIPETNLLSLEQIDSYYESDVKPWKTSNSRNKKILKDLQA